MKCIKNIRVGIIIPDRNDRPELLKNCLRMLEAQTLQPEIIELINFHPNSHEKDITLRYRTGYEKLRNKGLDIIAFWENDDYYSKDYLEIMVNKWLEKGQPDMLGTDYTIYYHLRKIAYFVFHHIDRSSALSTLIKPDLKFPWCQDTDPYTDMYLWSQCHEIKNKVIFHPEKHITIGIKHGVGLPGGIGHTDELQIFINPDLKIDENGNIRQYGFLEEHMDEESFNFYKNYLPPFTKQTLKIINGTPMMVPE